MSEKKQIVFVNQSAGYLMIDIIDAFKDNYDERILLTGFLNPRNKKLDDTVKVEKLITYDRSSSVKRIFTWFWAFIKALFLIRFKYPKAHLFLVSNPPFTALIPLFCKNSFDILVYDIYPDAFVEFGYFKKDSWIIKIWESINIKVYQKARKISTITDGMQERLTKYVTNDKVNVVPIWTDNSFLKPIPKSENSFLKTHQIEDNFIVMYSGNMGKAHPVEILVHLANHFQINTNIFFLLIGGGDKYKYLEASISKKKLRNIKIMPWQDANLLPFTLSGADLALVTVGNEASGLSIPSKTYNLMSVGTPILCVAPKESALSNLVEVEKIGVVFQENELQNMIQFIDGILSDKNQLMAFRMKAVESSLKYISLNAIKFL
ncbi:MAG: glycosyltransferase family 4 protein [Algoriphagus sp.]|uniref:glycosyltransferase family 4 protein n=1 Tax=Algoriphagus sp. TaxID=1872435 RepID=UPI00262A1ADB|nr:glycosyltransferase family 4 protein [Algoriphagus sp.]MDG1279214.1 glycosyltransferase family 4 protein [Algoriphagus sp.]